MHIQGSRTLHAGRDAVFSAIFDPEVLLSVIPGCREVELGADGSYHGRIDLRLPGMVGSYRTTVRPIEVVAPDRGRLEGEVIGAMGTLAGSASLQLTDAPSGAFAEAGADTARADAKAEAEPDADADALAYAGAATLITFDGQAVIGGPLARLDGRFVEGLARSLVDQGLDRLEARLQAASR